MPREFTLAEMGPEYVRVQNRIVAATVKGLRVAAWDGRRETVLQINFHQPHPVVDLQQLKRSPKVSNLPNGALLEVTAPHAAPQEFGTRPFTPPLSALIAWAVRKLRGKGKGRTKAEGGQKAKRHEKKKKRGDAKATAAKAKTSQRKKQQRGPSPEAKALGGAVWAKIRREGIEPKRYYQRAGLSFDAMAHRRISEAVAKVKS